MAEQEPGQRGRRLRERGAAFVGAFGSTGTLLAVFVLALACAAFLVSQKPQPADDAYITFRHVKNLVEHGRPAWNLSGNPVLGSTSPAFVFALGAFCTLLRTVEVERAALYLGAVFHFLTVLFTYLVARDLLGRAFPSVLAAAVIGVNAIVIHVSSQGFESGMLIVVLLSGLYFARIGRFSVALALASIAPLIRPEGVLLALLVWVAVLSRGRFKRRLLPAFLCIPLAWAAFSTAYYGSTLPHPLHAKKKFPSIYKPYTGEDTNLVARLPRALPDAVGLLRSQAGPLVLLGEIPGLPPLATDRLRGWLILLGLPLALMFCATTRDGRILHFLYPPLFLLLFGWIGHTMPWYFPSFVVFATLSLLAGWYWGIEQWVARAKRPTLVWRRHAARAMQLCVFVVFVCVNRYSLNRGAFEHQNKGVYFAEHPWGELWNLWEIQRYHQYRAAAQALNKRQSGRTTAMISEVGVFGYFFEGEVIDTVGLCSPEALPFYPPPTWDVYDEDGSFLTKRNSFTPTEMVESLRPDYLVNSRLYITNLLRAGSPFLDQYEQVYQGGMVWGEPVLIFHRLDSKDGNSEP